MINGKELEEYFPIFFKFPRPFHFLGNIHTILYFFDDIRLYWECMTSIIYSLLFSIIKTLYDS